MVAADPAEFPESQGEHKLVTVLKTYPATQVKWTVKLVQVDAPKVVVVHEEQIFVVEIR